MPSGNAHAEGVLLSSDRACAIRRRSDNMKDTPCATGWTRNPVQPTLCQSLRPSTLAPFPHACEDVSMLCLNSNTTASIWRPRLHSRPFAPRPTRCAVCRVHMAHVVCHYARALHSIVRGVLCRSDSRAGCMYRSSRWGAPRVRAAAFSSLAALAGFSPAPASPATLMHSHPPPALVRMR